MALSMCLAIMMVWSINDSCLSVRLSLGMHCKFQLSHDYVALHAGRAWSCRALLAVCCQDAIKLDTACVTLDWGEVYALTVFTSC